MPNATTPADRTPDQTRAGARRDLTDQTVVVLGATGAFGRRLTTALQAEGARVVALVRDEAAAGDLGERVVTVQGDLRDPDVAEVLRAAVEGEQVVGLVNAAGVVAFGPLEDTEADTMEALMVVDALAPLQVTRALLPRIVDGGVIAHVTGVIVDTPTAGLAAYSAAKSALSTALTVLRRELRRRRVDVIDLRPPHTETGLVDRALAGTPPALPEGADPDDVVAVMVEAILTPGSREVRAAAFA